MADSIYTFDPTASNNTTLDGIPYGPNQLYHNKIDDWFRSVGAKLAQFVDDLGGVNTVAGTGDAVTVTLASGITAYATGQLFSFKAGAANTGAATINVNGIGAKAIRKISGGTDVALSAGDIAQASRYSVVYDSTANSAAGAWILAAAAVAITGGTVTGLTSLTLASGVASPATNDAAALGTGALSWADLFLASGAVINFNNGDVLITHSANLLAFTGATSGYTFDVPIAVSSGGTGLATLTANNVILGNGTSTPSFVAPGTSGNVLTSNGTTWTSATPTAGFTAASQAEQEAGSSTTVGTTPGRQQFHPSAAKCWAYTTYSGGTPTLGASYNITSITDTAVGQLTITIATDFSSTSWSPQVSVAMGATQLSSSSSGSHGYTSIAAGSILVTVAGPGVGTDGNPVDPVSISFMGLGDQ